MTCPCLKWFSYIIGNFFIFYIPHTPVSSLLAMALLVEVVGYFPRIAYLFFNIRIEAKKFKKDNKSRNQYRLCKLVTKIVKLSNHLDIFYKLRAFQKTGVVVLALLKYSTKGVKKIKKLEFRTKFILFKAVLSKAIFCFFSFLTPL